MKIIKEFIAEHLINTEIFEMAQSIAEYRNTIDNKLPILIAHILLVMKSHEDSSSEFIEHWKKEIRELMRSLCTKKLKIKDTYDSRYHHLKDIIYRRDEIDTNDDYIWGLYGELYHKGYDLEDKEIYDSFIVLLHKFQDEILQDLVDILASKNFSRIMSFTDKL